MGAQQNMRTRLATRQAIINAPDMGDLFRDDWKDRKETGKKRNFYICENIVLAKNL